MGVGTPVKGEIVGVDVTQTSSYKHAEVPNSESQHASRLL